MTTAVGSLGFAVDTTLITGDDLLIVHIEGHPEPVDKHLTEISTLMFRIMKSQQQI